MFKDGKVKIDVGKFGIVQARKVNPKAFACIQDKNEITLIIDEKKILRKEVIKVEKGFRLITFDMALPFGMTGFISKILRALADENIPIFAISAFTTDHILVKEKYLKKTKEVLESLGFEIVG